MLKFLTSLFATPQSGVSSRGREVPAPKFAPGTQITYDPKLIGKFADQHQELLSVYGGMLGAAKASSFEELGIRIRVFRRLLSEHLLEENLRLYTYLQRCLVADPDSLDLVREMHQEMSQIGKKANQFIRHYSEFGVTRLNVAKFVEELEAIGAVLVDRIEREESHLYALYMSPESYALPRH